MEQDLDLCEELYKSIIQGGAKEEEDLLDLPRDVIGEDLIAEKPSTGHISGSTAWYTIEDKEVEGRYLLQIRQDFLVKDKEGNQRVLEAHSPVVAWYPKDPCFGPNSFVGLDSVLQCMVYDYLKQNGLKTEGWIGLSFE